MDELGELILGERPKVERQPNLVAPKKSPMSGLNPQLQPKVEQPDELGQLILSGGAEPIQAPAPTLAPIQRINPIEQLRQKQLADVQGVGEAGRSVLSGMFAAPVGALAGIAGTLTSGKYGTQQGIQAGQKTAQNVQEALTYQPPSQRGQEILQDLQSKFEVSKLPPVGVPEVMGMGMGQKPQPIQAPKIRIEPVTPKVVQPSGLQPAGAAATTNKAVLQQAIQQAAPDLAQELKTVNPKDLNQKALTNITEAESLKYPVRLTLGQAAEDANLISTERNARATQTEYLQRFNEQNKALQENVNHVKEITAPDVFAPNYVANAEGAMEFVGNKIKENESATKNAYEALDQYGAGKIKVDSETFANNAIKALTEKEDIDFLPSIIKSKIDTYVNGKEMNFAQYENLRTQIARETRKAQRADDGNAVHALTLVRGELEKLPLIGETVEAKALADKARSVAKAEFDLVNKDSPTYNKIYADIVNGKADTKDFIQSAVLRSKNVDFVKMMDLFKNDPKAVQHLRAGALDIIMKDATDASGNFKPARFNKAIENLDVNGKLMPLFGEDALTLKKIARAGQLVEARPAGAFVNESNTALQLMKQYGSKVAGQVPIVGRFVEPAQQLMQESAAKKQVKQSLKPGAGAKLSDIGK
jgi:hypothetical protein